MSIEITFDQALDSAKDFDEEFESSKIHNITTMADLIELVTEDNYGYLIDDLAGFLRQILALKKIFPLEQVKEMTMDWIDDRKQNNYLTVEELEKHYFEFK